MVRLVSALLLLAPGLLAAPWARHTIDDSGVGADGVRIADVNGDGLADVTSAWEQSGQVRAYVHPGHAKVREAWPAVTVGTVTRPEDAVFADINGDGVMDVVSSTEAEEKTIFVHLAPSGEYLDAEGWKTQPVDRSVGKGQWMFAVPMDVDGNGSMDLVAGSKNDFAAIGSWRFPTTAGGRASWSRWYGAGWVMSLVAHDMNGDGAVDIVASDRKGPRRGVLWFLNMPGSAAWPVSRVGPEGEFDAMFLDVADLDGDGAVDIVVAAGDGPIRYFRRLGARANNWRGYSIEVPEGFGSGKAVAVGDMDMDGSQDLVFTCEGADGELSGVGMLRHGGDPTASQWQASDIGGPDGVKFDRIELTDLDGDGDLDVLTTEESDRLGVVWYENPAK